MLAAMVARRSRIVHLLLVCASLALSMVLIGTDAARAQVRSTNLDIQAVVGFADTFTPGRWAPLSVTVGNRGNDVVAHLEVLTRHGDALADTTYKMTHRRTLQLTRDSRKRFQFTVFIASLSAAVRVRIVSDTEVLAQRELNLRKRLRVDALLLAVTRDADLDYLNRREGAALRVHYPLPELLPEHWRGYDAVRAVVLHGVSLDALSARQFEALKRWIANGGALAVSGGANYSILRTQRMATLLPAVPSGLTAVHDAPAVQRALGAPFSASSPFHVNAIKAAARHVQMQVGETPLVVSRPYGRGKVIYLTFDIARPPFARWSGMAGLLETLLPLATSNVWRHLPAEPADSDVLDALLERGATSFTSHATVLYFLALYLAVLVTGYRMRPRGRWTRALLPWMTWASPLLFAPAAYALFGPVLFAKGPTVLAAALIEPLQDSPYAHTTLHLGVFSTRSQVLALEYQGMEPAFLADPRSDADVTDWTVSSGARSAVRVDDDRSYVLHALRGEDVIPFDLRASLRATPAGPALSLQNSSGRALSELWLIYQGKGYSVGDLAADGEMSRAFDSALDANKVWPDAPWKILFPETARPGGDQDIARILYEAARAARETSDAPSPSQAVLLGYSSMPLRRAGASTRWRMDEAALLLIPIPELAR